LGKEYRKEDYVKQFTIRIPENLAKIRRVREFWKTEVEDTPEELFKVLGEQERRLLKARESFGDYVSPEEFPEE